MSTTKLCERCLSLFASVFADTDQIIAEKSHLIQMEARLGTRRPDIPEILRNGLEQYRIKAESRSTMSLVPCPWTEDTVPEYLLRRGRTEFGTEEISYHDIMVSAQKFGCQICWTAIRMIESQVDGDSLQFHEVKGRWELTVVEAIHRPISLHFHSWLGINVVFDIMLSDDQKDSEQQLRNPEGASTDHESCLSFFSESLKHCLKFHTKCSLDQSSWMPTRLLDVRPLGDVPDEVRVVETKNGVESSVYATLSHLWGKGPMLKLTKDCCPEFMQGISMELIPQCFRDAVHVARRLQIRYLWIDSLCIMQDDADDWARESATMHQVYQEGICNLAACNGVNATGSLFAERDPESGKAITFQWEFLDRTVTFTLIPNWIELTFATAPLYKRGWVVQERILCRRLMGFTKFPFWECEEGAWTEVQHCRSEYSTDIGLARVRWGLPFHLQNSNRKEVRQSWHSVVRYYSHCNLTFSSDKLIAIGGIAKTLARATNQTYLAGLWGGEELLWGLLWQCDHFRMETRHLSRPAEYRAPSWSWASIDDSVNFPESYSGLFDFGHLLAHLLSATTVPKAHDPFGQLVYGEIVLRGFLFESKLDFEWIWPVEKSQTNRSADVYLLVIGKYELEQSRNFVGIHIRKVDDLSPKYERVGAHVVDSGHESWQPSFTKEQRLRLLELHSPEEFGQEIILI